jgi:hypothetical protein
MKINNGPLEWIPISADNMSATAMDNSYIYSPRDNCVIVDYHDEYLQTNDREELVTKPKRKFDSVRHRNNWSGSTSRNGTWH